MFFFCKRQTLSVTLFTDNQVAFDFARPEKATKFFPEWWKQTPKTFFYDDAVSPTPTIKMCPGISDLYVNSIIQPLWSDFNIKINPDRSWKYQFSNLESKASNHGDKQLGHNKFNQEYVNIKLLSPWVGQEKTNIKFLLTSPFWNEFGFDNILIPPGVIKLKAAMEININMFFKRHAEPALYELPFGQPLVQIIPITEKNIVYKYEMITTQELKKIQKQGRLGMFFINRWRRAANLCPHA
jgi:hypothetical protein